MNLDFERKPHQVLTNEEFDARAQARREERAKEMKRKMHTRRQFLALGAAVFALVGVSELAQRIAPSTQTAIEQAQPGETFPELVRDADPNASSETIKDNTKRFKLESGGATKPTPNAYYVVNFPEK